MASKVTLNLDVALQSKIDKIKEATEYEPMINEMGKKSVTRIVGLTKTGKDINTGKNQPALAESTVDQREYLKKFNSTGNTFAPARSNLTLTGQLLDSVTFKKTKLGFDVVVEGDRTPYKNGSNKAPSNKELANYLAEKGRKFLGVDDELRKNLKSILLRYLRRFLRN